MSGDSTNRSGIGVKRRRQQRNMSSLRLPKAELRPNFAALTADRIRDAILARQFVTGDRLGIEDLADRVGVSTMPVREALISLEQEGLVERLPRRGFRVAAVQSADVADIFVLHSFLAGVLASRAAESASEQLVDRLSDIQRQIVAAAHAPPSSQRAAKVERLNHEFHRTINRCVNSQRLRWFLRTTTRYVPASFYRSIPGWIQTTIDDHPLIIDALGRRDSNASRKLMEEHVLRGGRLVIDAFTRREASDGTAESE